MSGAQLVDASGRRPLRGQLVLGRAGAIEGRHERLAVGWAASLSAPTRAKYVAAAGELLAANAGHVTAIGVARWRDELVGAGQAPATIARKLAAVRSLARTLEDHGALEPGELAQLLDVASPRVGRGLAEPIAASDEDVDALDEAAWALWPEDPLRRSTARTIVALEAGCGLRVAETCAIRVGDVRVRRPTIAARQARGGRPPTAALVLDLRRGTKRGEQRTVPVPRLARTVLDEHRRLLLERIGGDRLDDELPLLPALTRNRPAQLVDPPGPIGERTVQRIVERLAAHAGVDAARHPHALRHAYGMRQARAGLALGVLMRRMGHRRAETTAVYMRASEADLLDTSRDPWEGRS